MLLTGLEKRALMCFCNLGSLHMGGDIVFSGFVRFGAMVEDIGTGLMSGSFGWTSLS